MVHLILIPLLILGVVNGTAEDFTHSKVEGDEFNPYRMINENSWNFGEGLSEGDVFLYDICDWRFWDSYTGEYARCYSISLRIENKISMNNNTFYLFHGITKDHTGVNDRLFLVDSEQYNVKSIFHKDADYANSLQNTIFWQSGWGKSISTEYGAQTILLEYNNAGSALILSDTIIAENRAAQYTATHDSFESSHLTINDYLPFPISSDIFTYGDTIQTTRHLFSFELQNYTNQMEYAETPYPEIHNEFFEAE